MVKPFLSLMIVLFLGGGGLLTAIFVNWQNERCIRLWESLRLRGYENYYRQQFNDALDFFQRSQKFAADLGRNNFRYALSYADMAKLYTRQGDYGRARNALGRAISIFDRQTDFDRAKFPLHEDRILLDCQLVDLDLKSGKGVKKAWKDCERGLNDYYQLKASSVDPTVARTLCQTLAAIGDAAAEAKDDAVLGKVCSTTTKIADMNPSLKGLTVLNQKHMQCPFAAKAQENLEDVLARAESEMKAKHGKEAREALKQAQEMAGSSNSARAQIEYLSGRIDYSEFKLEDAEKHFLAAIRNPEMKDDKARDDMLLRLSAMYKQGGYPDDAIEAMKQDLDARVRLYGSDTSKVTDVEVDLARYLQEQGRVDEGKKYLQHAQEYYNASRKEGAGNLGVSSEKLAAVLIPYGELKQARAILETMIQQYEEGMKKQAVWIATACYDLAVLSEMEGKHAESEQFFKQGLAQQDELNNEDRIVLADQTLKYCALQMKERPLADKLISQTIMTLAPPSDRREGIRVQNTIDAMQSLKKSHPGAFSPRVEAQIKTMLQASSKYPRARLSGWN